MIDLDDSSISLILDSTKS